MKILYSILLSFMLVSCLNPTPVSIILDTDCGPDYDDVGALASIYALQSAGKCNVLGIMSSNKQELVVPTINLISTYYGFPDMPIGEVKGEGVNIAGWHKQSWAQFLVDKYKPQLKSGEAIPDAVKLYRKLLSQAKEKEVTICTIGFLTNVSNLLNSVGDEYSTLTGKELIEKKVKRLVVMGGGFPNGDEFNIKEDASASINTVENWPTPIYFCGFEIGEKVITGKPTAEMKVENNPVVDAFRVALPQDTPAGRCSWDQLTVISAINGFDSLYTLKRGKIIIEPNGKNSWEDNENGNHYYMIPSVPYETLSKEVEHYMMFIPK